MISKNLLTTTPSIKTDQATLVIGGREYKVVRIAPQREATKSVKKSPKTAKERKNALSMKDRRAFNFAKRVSTLEGPKQNAEYRKRIKTERYNLLRLRLGVPKLGSLMIAEHWPDIDKITQEEIDCERQRCMAIYWSVIGDGDE